MNDLMKANASTELLNEVPLLEWAYSMQSSHLSRPGWYKPGNRPGMTQEILDALTKETDYEFTLSDTNPLPVLPREDLELVGTGQKKCPLCSGTRHIFLEHTGAVTGVKVALPNKCPCVGARAYYGEWHDIKKNPPAVRDCTFMNLIKGKLRNRFPLMSDLQYNTLLAVMYAFPQYSFLLSGLTGTGKSTFLTCRYNLAVSTWARQTMTLSELVPGVWKMNAQTLAEEQREYAARSQIVDSKRRGGDMNTPAPPQPSVTPKKIQAAARAGLVPCLFLDEFDKFKPTEFQYNSFFALIETLNNEGGQAFLCTNDSLKGMIERLGQTEGKSFLRRVIDLPKGVFIDLQDNKFYVNRIPHYLTWEDNKPVLNADLNPSSILELATLPKSNLTPPVQAVVPWDRFLPPDWLHGCPGPFLPAPPAADTTRKSGTKPLYPSIPRQWTQVQPKLFSDKELAPS